jgi:predicted nucleic acid-binding protein
VRDVLDANIAIAAMNGVAAVRDRLARIGAADVGIPLVAIAELVFGAYRSRRREENLERVAALRQTVQVLPLTVPAVPSAGSVARAHRWRRPLQCDNS